MKKEDVFEGDLTAKAGEVYRYTKITGYLDAGGADTKTAFPKLTSVGGDIYAPSIEKGAFPKLTSVGGYIYAPSGNIEKGAFPQLTSVGGNISAPSGNIEKGAFPKLTSVGGYIYASSGDFSHVKVNDANAANRCRAMLLASFEAAGFSFADGILARIVSQRGPVSRVVICGKTEISFLVTDGEAFSHGATLAEARDGLIYKICNRDTTEFKAWALDKVVTKRDAIRAYRTITGACEIGVRAWMEQRKTPGSVSVREI